jgi:hypothetical protein
MDDVEVSVECAAELSGIYLNFWALQRSVRSTIHIELLHYHLLCESLFF